MLKKKKPLPLEIWDKIKSRFFHPTDMLPTQRCPVCLMTNTLQLTTWKGELILRCPHCASFATTKVHEARGKRFYEPVDWFKE